jgi:hypothetical protein
MDGYPRIECGGTDCDDTNEDVYVGQLDYFSKARANGTFDYNCNAVDEPEFETYTCSGAECNKTSVFLFNDVPCGQVGSWGNCNLLCNSSAVVQKTKQCR